MACERHPNSEPNITCDVETCGACYGEQLLAEPMPDLRRAKAAPDLSRGLSGRQEHWPPKDQS